MKRVCFVVAAIVSGVAAAGDDRSTPRNVTAKDSSMADRTRDGLLVLYDFRSTSGAIVQDRSGVGKPVDLRIADVKAVRRGKGSLQVHGKTVIRSDKAASKIINALRRSREITIEAWIRPADSRQSGPARVVTLSRDSGQRNFTLGQERDGFEVRLRTAKTSTNGMPALSSQRGVAAARLTHVVYTRDRKGFARLTINGKRAGERRITGALANWDAAFRFALANELSNDRPWQGTYYLVAIYQRALSMREIEQNLLAGPGAGAAAERLAQRKLARNERLFKTRVAPLLARRCLECHGGKSKKGKLNLSRRFAALRGGESGRAIVPGKSSDSPLWTLVKSNDMPKNRTPLSPDEKRLLQFWIDNGAAWPLETIDASQYAPRRGDGSDILRRLTVSEYIATVRAAVGVDIAADARKLLPPDLRADGFSNTAYNLTVDLGHVQAFARLARTVVERMDVVKFAARYSRSRQTTDANLNQIIAGMGKWILRGPLNKKEVAAYLRVAAAVKKEGGDFKEAVSYVLEAMLQSPRFLYRMEIQRGAGKPRAVEGYELANRLSYMLWGGPPDAELFRAADANKLSDSKELAAQVRRMLNDPRAARHSRRFIAEWLNLDRLSNLRPDRKRFPGWDPQLAADMRAETLAFYDEIAWRQNRPLSDLFNAPVTFLTPRLAKHYGLKGKPGEGRASANGNLARYDLSNVPARGGLLTQGSVLTIGGDEASMVTRGLFVLKQILNGHVNDPPPCVDTTPVPAKPGLSQRGIALARIANKSCGGCHSAFEPLAFGLERFDGLGSYREKDHHGNKLRDDGEVLFPGTDKAVPYRSSAELMNLLAKSDRVQKTVTRRVVQWSLGRPLGKEDEPLLEKIHQAAYKEGGTYRSLMTAIVTSDLVRKTRGGKRSRE